MSERSSKSSTPPLRLVEGGAQNAEEQQVRDLLMRLPAQVVEDDLARERVWRKLPGPETQPRRRWLLAVPALAAVAAAVLVWRWAPPKENVSARLEMAAGKVLVAQPREGWIESHAGARLTEASRLRTDPSSRALISMEGQAALLVQPGSDVAIESLGRRTFLRLSGGELVAKVVHRSADDPFVVQTTRCQVLVTGTVFSVREQAAGEVVVNVAEGVVEVHSGEARIAVHAGESWSSAKPGQHDENHLRPGDRQLLEDALAAPGEREQVRVESTGTLSVHADGIELGPTPLTWQAPVGRHHFIGRDEVHHTFADADAVTSPGFPADVTLTPQEAEPTSVEVITSAPRPAPVTAPTSVASLPVSPSPDAISSAIKTHPSPVATPRSDHGTNAVATGAHEVSHASTQEPVPVPVPNVSPPTESASANLPAPTASAPEDRRYADAVSLSKSGRYEEAAKALESLTESQGAHADLALYELGRLRQRELKDLAGADKAFRQYRASYPGGSLGQEVELSLIEVEIARNQRDAALGDLTHFLSEHPTSERGPEMHLLRGNLLREKGDCRSAIDEYRSIAEVPALGGDALYFTAWCQRKLGQLDEAESSLKTYLVRFPEGAHAAEARDALQSH
jgi:ferric-dicitrate binding protein FerR (iron transport regulator)/TolA-binding protein